MSLQLGLDDFADFENEIDNVTRIINNLAFGKNELDSADKDIKRCVGSDTNTILHGLKTTIPSKIPMSRTSINETSNPETLTHLTSDSLPQEAFMRMVEEDANRRSKERTERNEKAACLMKKGNVAFREGHCEKALLYYNEAIEIRRDSSLLYVNRAVTHLRLGLPSKTIQDCENAIKLNDTLKPHLLKCKSLKEMCDFEGYQAYVKFTKEKFSDHMPTIIEYLGNCDTLE